MKLSHYQNLLAVSAVAIFYTNLPLYLYRMGVTLRMEAPKHWVLGLAAASIPILYMQCFAIDVRRLPILIWCAIYLWVSIIGFFPSLQSDLDWQGLRYCFFQVISFFTMAMVFCNQKAVWWARTTLIATVCVGVLLNIYELFYPMTFTPSASMLGSAEDGLAIPGRSAGFYLNANQAATALAAGMILAVPALEQRWRAPFMLFVGVGLIPTFSRQGMVAWGIAVLGSALTRKITAKDLMVSGLIGLLLATLVVLPRWDNWVNLWQHTGVWNKNIEERLYWFMNPTIEVSAYDIASQERARLTARAWDSVMNHPLIGLGTGASLSGWLPHNMYLLFLLEHGILGAAVFPLLILATVWSARGEAKTTGIIFAVAIGFMGFFSHTMLNDTYFMTLFSLMAAIAATSRETEAGNLNYAPVQVPPTMRRADYAPGM
jgi:hypothetical protein